MNVDAKEGCFGMILLFATATIALVTGYVVGLRHVPSSPKAAWSLYQETVETERIRHQEALGVSEQGEKP